MSEIVWACVAAVVGMIMLCTGAAVLWGMAGFLFAAGAGLFALGVVAATEIITRSRR